MADAAGCDDPVRRRIDMDLDDAHDDGPAGAGGRISVVTALESLPQSQMVSDRLECGNLSAWAVVDEDSFHRVVADWLVEYGRMVSTARTSAAQMSAELADYRTFGQVLRRLIAGQEGL